MGELGQIADSGTRYGKAYNTEIRVLIPVAGGPDEELATDFAHRVDRRVVEAEADGFKTFSVQRQYHVPLDIVRDVPQLEDLSIGSHPVGSGGPGVGEVEPPEETLGSEARARLHLEDLELGESYEISGREFLPGDRDIAIIVKVDVA